ncbi:MAG TPA: VapE domain-containing protein [Xanthobacteraceae bacterium]|nr:VapE domain-containing protein [Xanthobacteraceae bacterium]
MEQLFDDAALQAGTQEAMEFLTAYYRGRDFHCVGIAPDGGVIAKSAGPDDVDALAEWIQSQQGRYNIYFAVNGLRPGVRNRKAKKADIAEANALHVDIDHGDGLDRVQKFSIPPTVVLFSGGGYQAFWLLKEPTPDLDLVERLNRGLAAHLGGDKCHNVDRIMRVPGTINLPNAKKKAAGRVPIMAKVVSANWEVTYAPEDFAAFLDAAPVAASPAPAAISEDQVVPVGLDDLPTSLPAYVRALIEHGDDPERPRGSANARYRSRSEAVYSVICALAKAGCSAQMIAGVLINPAYPISASILERKNPKTYALRQAQAAIQAVSEDWSEVDKGGRPRATLRNSILAARRLGLRFAYDQFRQRKMIQGHLLEDQQGEISDDAVLMIRKHIMDRFGFDPRSDYLRDAITILCLEGAFHPIRDMLSGLVWDGIPRLDRWMSTYLEAPDTALNGAIGRIVLVAAVRRVRRPGTKFDQILVLEGRQGSGKSSTIKILAGEGNHSDQEILALDAKAQMELLSGVWLYELGEIEGMRKADVSKIKAFCAREVDRARMAYAYFATARPRQTIFIGTTNEDRYLRDLTGNRRFWPVKTGNIDLEALRRDRDQLLAEAAQLEEEGASIVLPEELWEAAAREQEARLEEDPWLSFLEGLNGKAYGDQARLFTDDLLTRLGIAREHQHQGHSKRLAGLMRKLGWIGDKFNIGRRTIRGYWRPKASDHVDDITTDF